MTADNSNEIYFLCGKCDQSLVISAEAAGMEIDCPHCGTAIIVPAGETGDAGAPRDPFEPPLSADAAATVERCLVVVMGPIGSPLAKNAISQASTSEELQEMLLGCIPSPHAQDAFLEACRNAFSAPKTQNGATQSGRQSEASSSTWDPAAVEAVTRNLAAYIGPIASIMVQRALPKARTGAELYKQLAAGITDEKDREKFLQSAPAALQ
jgi:hypothetical protein